MSGDSSENHRLQCEARYWLKQTGYSPQKIALQLDQIRKKRGKEGATRLRDQMRIQWKLNHQRSNRSNDRLR